MKLAGYLARGGGVERVQELRDLSADELKQHARFQPVVAEARGRLALFRVLDANYRAWTDFLQSLLHPGAVDEPAAARELDRLLLNYLTCAYHLRAHFEATFQQRLRAGEAEQKKYKMLYESLCQTSWPFAFFLDFGNYLKHQGLGLGHFRRKVGPVSVSLELTLHAGELLDTTKDWPRSKLTPAKGVMELSGLLRDFHGVMMQKYSGIVVQTLFADLAPAAEFYQKLATEVRAHDPGLTMALRNGEGAPAANDSRLIFTPNDLLGELGLVPVTRK